MKKIGGYILILAGIPLTPLIMLIDQVELRIAAVMIVGGMMLGGFKLLHSKR